ncbi:DUF1517 domain-containing protein [Spirulina subsalsa FACHB-351]|uniref:DUF1517 domain-containing protein n=1 Tax=Spirulina subsalsa FACHB-351 TaxID=234711 RepID=A0ABT3L0B5_9CYAN|nr:DUF1517 domain-containing protein [Spirulina subsalsa]MCW6034942.1 DUF1517 domain-containing protein [Spirulina subsalsa FACHB-351]
MSPIGDRLNQMMGRKRLMVCRLFLQITGSDIAPLLGILNQAGREAIASEGDLRVLGDSLEQICQSLLDVQHTWQAAANEGDIFWQEEEAGDYVNTLFTDSAQRYLSQPSLGEEMAEDTLSIPITRHIVVMITVAAEGEVQELETDLADLNAMTEGLKSLINLHYEDRLRAIQVHFSPARLGDQLTDEQILLNFPELIPL